MKKTFLYILLSTLLSSPLLAQINPKEGLNIWFDRLNQLTGMGSWYNYSSDKEWEERSLPIGNGSFGGNILGSIAAERITLNEKSLWRGGPNTSKGAAYYWNVNKESAHLLPEIRQAFAEGEIEKAQKLTEENFNGLAQYEAENESPFRFGSYTTLGEIYIETGLSEVGMNQYQRILSLDSAMAVVRFQKDGVQYERTSFASYPDSVMVLKFSADKPGMQNLTFSYAGNPEATGKIIPQGNNGLLYTGKLNNNQMEFALCIHAHLKGGTVQTTSDGKLFIRNADEVIFLLTADTDYRINFNPNFDDPKTYVGTNPKNNVLKMMEAAETHCYNELLVRHKADYTSLFNRVKLQLNPNAPTTYEFPGVNDLPTYKRLERYRQGRPDYKLEEIYYQYGRYLLIASSRPGNLPANLQGLWANGVDGPWRVDYHNNINIQMNYWPACPTNLTECNWPLIDFIRTLVKPGEKVAQSYFGARGWTASVSANIFGFTSPLASQNMSWNFSPMAGPWLATHIWEYYDYTRDKKFLKEIGYPLIKSSALFASDYLWHRPDGSYTAAPSTSPEHGPVDEGATFVHAVIREILMNAIDAAKALGIDTKERKQWQHILNHLAPYQIGRYGQLMEWSKDIDDPKDQHRHVNHLFGLHPGHTISPITTPELAKASRIVLEHRGDGATGWSMGWKLNQWARLQDGNHAYTLFGNLLKNGTMDNLWDTHPPFQIDGNFGGTAGMTELLLQSHMGFIQLLPALPDAWEEGSVEGLLARGNFVVDLRWSNGKLQEAVITSNAGEPCQVRYGNQLLSFKTKKGQKYMITSVDGKLIKK
ncbi:MAG: glycoside hydrolase family 95 protein [Bacteroides sp.]|nr:glycoside hydrolase family 95 protein [Bacteroides sp.]